MYQIGDVSTAITSIKMNFMHVQDIFKLCRSDFVALLPKATQSFRQAAKLDEAAGPILQHREDHNKFQTTVRMGLRFHLAGYS